ncbi:MAG: HAD family acid phosphatase [Acidobacteriota bacterium]|nr:HAD family acid phosphatase [Acidobacteriota bacterium]
MTLRVMHGLGRLVGLAVVGVAVGAAQAPVVPVDHYGPPVCDASAKHAATRMSAAKAIAIEEKDSTDATMLPAVTPLENFAIARYRLADYADCVGTGGCYWADLDAQYKRAEGALDRQLTTRKHGEKLAVVLDIDETSLSGYCEMQQENYGYIKAMSDVWTVGSKAAVAIPGAVRLFNRAKAAGVEVFFITGRPEPQRAATARNLEAAGFHGWKRLDLRSVAEHETPASEYKASRRRKIVADGYRLILSVGDQWSDLRGEPRAEVSVKLPNPFYFLP